MPRYIDADALLETEPEVCADYGEEYGSEFGYSRDQIANAPTISPDEARGVVHCGECKFWRRPPSCEGLARCETGETGIRYRSKNDFCSRGENDFCSRDEKMLETKPTVLPTFDYNEYDVMR